MNTPLVSGNDYLLDDKVIVKVLKPATRSNMSYIIEIPGHSIESVDRERLKAITMPAKEATR